MKEYQILTRLNKTRIAKGRDRRLYGNCQVCNDKFGQFCIEASRNDAYRIHCVFVFCVDCHSVLNEICSIFIYKKKKYTFEDSYPLYNSPFKQTTRWFRERYYLEPIWRT